MFMCKVKNYEAKQIIIFIKKTCHDCLSMLREGKCITSCYSFSLTTYWTFPSSEILLAMSAPPYTARIYSEGMTHNFILLFCNDRNTAINACQY